MAERKAVAWETIRRYRQADRRGKTAILNEFVSTTELSRKYAIQLLKGTLRVHPRPLRARPQGRPPCYGPAVKKILIRLWAMFGFMFGKRLACAICINLAVLEKFDELQGLSSTTRKRLLTISPATIDRLLVDERKRLRLKGRSHTRPGSLRKSLRNVQKPVMSCADLKVGTLFKSPMGRLRKAVIWHCQTDFRRFRGFSVFRQIVFLQTPKWLPANSVSLL